MPVNLNRPVLKEFFLLFTARPDDSSVRVTERPNIDAKKYPIRSVNFYLFMTMTKKIVISNGHNNRIIRLSACLFKWHHLCHNIDVEDVINWEVTGRE